MVKRGVLIVSYVPAYNRQGRDLNDLLQSLGFDSVLVQLDGETDVGRNRYGVNGIKPKGAFHKFIMLWNAIRFCYTAFCHRRSIVVGVGRPSLIVCAFSRIFFARKIVWYSLEFAMLGAVDKWIYKRLVAAYIDVEENRLRKFSEHYGEKSRVLVINNMPLLHDLPVRGGKLIAYLKGHGVDLTGKRIVIYAGSYQTYACIDSILAASELLPDNMLVVLMAFGIAPDIATQYCKCVVIPPVHGEGFYDWLADADCSLLPYESTSDFNVQNCSPQKIFDCYLVGVPYVASDRPIIRKVLSIMPEAGMVCNFTTPDSIAAAIRIVSSRRSQVRERMESLHRNRFNYGVMANQVFAFFKELE